MLVEVETVLLSLLLRCYYYIGFGIMCAMSFGNLNGNALIMLASTKVVRWISCHTCMAVNVLPLMHIYVSVNVFIH